MKDYRKYGVKRLVVKRSNRQNKQLMATFDYKGLLHTVHFGDPTMREYPGTKRGDNYCSRSYGLEKSKGVLNDPLSPNFWSRRYLWNCDGKISKK